FHSTSGTFYNPQIRFSNGSFTSPNTNYSVYLDHMAGTPNNPTNASNVGQLVMFLPQGTYRLYPSVTPASGGTYAMTGLEPIDLTVGCGDRITLEPCLQLDLNTPACLSTKSATITGSVRSCTNVASIAYTLNGGSAQLVCASCGVNPTFNFNVDLGGECLENALTVTATDVLGGVSSV